MGERPPKTVRAAPNTLAEGKVPAQSSGRQRALTAPSRAGSVYVNGGTRCELADDKNLVELSRLLARNVPQSVDAIDEVIAKAKAWSIIAQDVMIACKRRVIE